MKNSNKKGFTLIELLIVLTIIAILSGAALAALSGFRQSARDTRRIADMQNMQSYLELYFNRCGRYPGNGNATTCSSGGSGSITWGSTVSGAPVAGTVADQLRLVMDYTKVPMDPASFIYLYGVTANGLNYVVGAPLESGNSALNGDLDGTQPPAGGINCGTAGATDNVYCIGT